MRNTLYIVPVHHPRLENLELLKQALSEVFSLHVEFLNLELDIEAVFNIRRHQYHSTEILAYLLDRMPDDTERILAVTDLDLYIPILTFVFGEAQLRGRAAVVSCHRLKNEFYGIPADNDILMDRLIKEAVHELGHTYGLIHCTNYACVMHASTYVEEIDIKDYHFCPACQALLAGTEPRQP
ncbi:MAG: archaemetzincin family Zn-dependent metalloprotease [Calditrichaeota bacterium]|nr:archaemetzincin family Zn-dependent metalloprotease [Calditrichota bacterium]